MGYKFISLNTRTLKKHKIQETGDIVQLVKYLLGTHENLSSDALYPHKIEE